MDQVATIEEKVLANEESIVSLEEQNAILYWIINFVGTDVASMQAAIVALEADQCRTASPN